MSLFRVVWSPDADEDEYHEASDLRQLADRLYRMNGPEDPDMVVLISDKEVQKDSCRLASGFTDEVIEAVH